MYDSGGKLLALKYTNGNTYFYVRNAQGDIIKIVDTSGNVVVEYAYDAWGKPMGVTGSMAATLGVDNPFRYRGYYYDTETGLYYLNQRYYNPNWGRFINADNVLGKTGGLLTHNVYSYCANNPVIRTDEGGNFFFTALGAIIGGVIGAVDAAINGEDVVAGALGGMVSGAMMGALADITVATGGAAAPVAVALGVGLAAGALGNATTQIVSGVRKGKSFSESVTSMNRTQVIVSGVCGAATCQLGSATGQIISKTVFEPVKQAAKDAAKRYAYNQATNWSYGQIRKAALKASLYELAAGIGYSSYSNFAYRSFFRYARKTGPM